MCGIIGYIGNREAKDILLKGLYRLEYRGYDSAGIALLNSKLNLYKSKGKVNELEKKITNRDDTSGKLGIAHTRWATHGEPNDINAHPHFSSDNSIAIIHNGIIENFFSIKTELLNKGYRFRSDTDSEVLAYLIEDIKKHNKCSLDKAVRQALTQVVGAYAIVVISSQETDELVAAKKSSPLVIGIGKNKQEFFIASDATPIIEYTKDVVYLNDNEVAFIKGKKLHIKSLTEKIITPYVQTIDMELSKIEKGGFDSFMLKEIFEQPNSIQDCLRGRIILEKEYLALGGIKRYFNDLIETKRIIIFGCGTSWHAGLIAEYIIEDLARTSVEVEYASEFRYRNPIINKNDIVIAISQSGETADTLAAIELAKAHGAIIIGVCNVVGSSIARNSYEGAYTHAGPEIGVASTKAFTTQVTIFIMLALIIAREKNTLKKDKILNLMKELKEVPDKIKQVLSINESIKTIADIYKDAKSFLYLGRGYNFPIALEGALKLKEISYIHAEGYPAAEMKHGPIAIIDEKVPIVIIATKDSCYDKIVSNISEVKSRGGKVIAVITKGDTLIPQIADHVIEVPQTYECIMPLISVVPLQLLSYHIAIMKKRDVDRPRNLAKSVTVE